MWYIGETHFGHPNPFRKGDTCAGINSRRNFIPAQMAFLTTTLKDVIVNSIENRYAETLLSEERKVSAPSQETLFIIA
ncbi:MAG: hypothetical protein A2007_01270 [Verrucomicrobia bacterium GWC2_42_7]|nr:MAG: hypothetical protein A2007_01270 [Verrucomicrobia bacterium GWC2_42_7]